MKMKIGICINNSNLFADQCSTVLMITEAQLRGHEVFLMAHTKLALKDGIAYASDCVKLDSDAQGVVCTPHKSNMFLDEFDVILFRSNPPFDTSYISATYVLERTKALVLNDPKSIRNNPDKILPLLFYKFMPQTLMTESESEIVNFFLEHDEDIILKPVHDRMGQFNVRVTNRESVERIARMMVKLHNSPIIAQKKCTTTRDKRFTMIDGEVIMIVARFSTRGELRLAYGDEPITSISDFTANERNLCVALSKFLRENNLFYVTVDTVDEYLLEVNVTSPGIFVPPNSEINVERIFWDRIEDKVHQLALR